MRTPTIILAGSLLVACSSGTRVVYLPAPAPTTASATRPAPTPAPRPAPVPMPPVGVTIVRAEQRSLLLSTNQPAYVAVFDIEPYRGVTLVYPSSPRQRQVALSGSSWLTVSWRSERGLERDERDVRGYRRQPSVHHVYAIASERPLRLTDGAFDDESLRAMLGTRAYAAADPYQTMAALARRFVPPVAEEDWGEDVYTMDVMRTGVPARVARIYCPDGSVSYVREDVADRAACPYRGRAAGSANAPLPRPDSVVASNGRPVQRRMEPEPVRVFRVPVPVDAQNGAPPRNGGESAARGTGGNADAPHEANDAHRGWPAPEQGVQLQGKPEKPPQGKQQDTKPEQKSPAAKPEVEGDAKPKSEKGARGVIEVMRERARREAAAPAPTSPDGAAPRARPDSSSEAASKKGKPEARDR